MKTYTKVNKRNIMKNEVIKLMEVEVYHNLFEIQVQIFVNAWKRGKNT